MMSLLECSRKAIDNLQDVDRRTAQANDDGDVLEDNAE